MHKNGIQVLEIINDRPQNQMSNTLSVLKVDPFTMP